MINENVQIDTSIDLFLEPNNFTYFDAFLASYIFLLIIGFVMVAQSATPLGIFNIDSIFSKNMLMGKNLSTIEAKKDAFILELFNKISLKKMKVTVSRPNVEFEIPNKLSDFSNVHI